MPLSTYNHAKYQKKNGFDIANDDRSAFTLRNDMVTLVNQWYSIIITTTSNIINNHHNHHNQCSKHYDNNNLLLITIVTNIIADNHLLIVFGVDDEHLQWCTLGQFPTRPQRMKVWPLLHKWLANEQTLLQPVLGKDIFNCSHKWLCNNDGRW